MAVYTIYHNQSLRIWHSRIHRTLELRSTWNNYMEIIMVDCSSHRGLTLDRHTYKWILKCTQFSKKKNTTINCKIIFMYKSNQHYLSKHIKRTSIITTKYVIVNI